MDWLSAHADVISAAASVGTFLVWVVYANFFYRDFKRERRPLILIDQISGPQTDSTCTLANLSPRTVYLECVFAVAELNGRKFSALVTEHAAVSSIEQGERRIVSTARQGPVTSGQLISIGSISELAKRALQRARSDDARLEDVVAVEVRVVATMGTEDQPIGASKRFDVRFDGGDGRSRPARIGTRQLLSRKDRREVRRWLDGLYADSRLH